MKESRDGRNEHMTVFRMCVESQFTSSHVCRVHSSKVKYIQTAPNITKRICPEISNRTSTTIPNIDSDSHGVT